MPLPLFSRFARLFSKESGPIGDRPQAAVAPGLNTGGSATAEAGADRPVLLHIRNRQGSPEHYYHFLLGFMAPLFDELERDGGQTRYLVRSVGPMDAHLLALGLPNLTILPKADFVDRLARKTEEIKRLDGYDDAAFYDADCFGRLRAFMLRRPPSPDTVAGPKVLMIDRGASPAYYQSDAVEVKTSADLRRTVPNMAELCAALRDAGHDARVMTLEDASMATQIRAFDTADMVIAQHGAALANMIWMEPGAAIVEINPKPLDDAQTDCFRALANVCGHRYAVIRQVGKHAPVPTGDLLEAVKTVRF